MYCVIRKTHGLSDPGVLIFVSCLWLRIVNVFPWHCYWHSDPKMSIPGISERGDAAAGRGIYY